MDALFFQCNHLRTLPDGTTLTRLPNGLRVIISRRTHTEAASLALAIGFGSKHETARTNGLTHFLEHMLFEGTAHYPNPSDLNRAVANIGGDFNAATSVESTVFTMQLPDAGWHEAIAILADVICSPLLNEEEVRRQRQVVAEEVGEKEDDPYEAMENAFAKLAFPNHGLGLSITGTPAQLKRYTATHLRALHARAYRPDNMVLTIVTDRPPSHILDAVGRSFRPLRGHTRLPRPRPAPRPRTRLSHRFLDGSQAYVTIGGRGPAWGSPDRPALDVVMAALGGSMHARLPMLLRETLGEVYNIQSGTDLYVETGLFSTSTDCSPSHLPHVIRQIVDGYTHLHTHPLTKDEIELAQHVLVGNSVVQFEQLAARAEFYATQLLLHNRFATPAFTQTEWKRVRGADVERAISAWIQPRGLLLTGLGPVRRPSLSTSLPH